MPYHIDEENSELAFEVREGNKLVIKIKSNIFSDSLELYLIKVGDNTEPTDKNVFSSLRVLKEIENLHDTILKEINSVTSGFWELKQDSQGNEYIATKYNVLTEGGLTTYGLGEQKLGTIYDGLPIDNNTIYWEEVEGSRVLKAKGSGGGSTGLDETKLWNVLGTPGDQQIDYSHLSDAFSQFSNEFVTINTEQEITALKHFTAGLSIGSAKKKIYEKNGVLYIDSNVAITGALTMYATDGQSVSSIYDGLPIDNDTIYWETVEGSRVLKAKGGSSFDENAMWSALSGSSNNQINKSHLTDALAGYATTEALNSVSNKLNDFLEGSDADTIINKWKELEAFLSGMAETDNLAEILETKADKKYVDSTFVTLGTKQTITGEKTFSSLLNTAAIKASGEITTPSLAASDYVTIAGIKLRKLEDGALMLEGNLALTGALTMYASNGQSFDTIYDGLPIDNDTIYWQEVDGSRVLKAREGSGSSFDKSAMWTALAGSTTEQINKSHLTTALTGYATESWVSGKNYAVKATTLAGYGITDGINAVSVTGTGNAVTAASISGHTLTLTKGSTFSLSGHKHAWADITSGKPSTLSGYGITDAPTKTGSGASGTWSIDISGKASNAGKLDGYYETDFFRARDNISYSILENFVSRKSGTYNVGYGGYSGLLTVFYFGAGSTSAMEILAPYYDPSRGLQLRYAVDNNRFTSWRSFAFEDGNIASATKLQTTRELWGRPFDGTENISGDMTNVGWINNSLRINAKDNNDATVLQGIGHSFIFGDSARYAHVTYRFRPNYGSQGPTQSSVFIENASAATNGDPTYTTTHYFRQDGAAYHRMALGVGREATNYGIFTNTIYASDWFRSEGNTGWYSQTYGGGWYMLDETWMRVYGNKNIYTEGMVEANGGFMAFASYSDTNSASHKLDIFNCAFKNTVEAYVKHNSSRSMLGWMDTVSGYGYRTRYVIGSERGYNSAWGKMYLAVSNNDNGTSIGCNLELRGDGWVVASGSIRANLNILADGGCSFYGSDIRYKSIIHPVMLLALNKIAEAPSFVYRWNRPNMNQNRLNLGGSAQYTQSILPWAVEDNSNFLMMDYATVAYTFAVHTARHLMNYESKTDKKIKKLENRVKYLEKQFKKLGYEEASIVDDQGI